MAHEGAWESEILIYLSIYSNKLAYFIILKRIESEEHLISGCLIEENPSSTLFQHFELKKGPAVPYFCISNRLNSQPYLILEFPLE